MAGEKFKLNFISNGEGVKYIDEPEGHDAADYVLEQESGRLGRDVSFAGGEVNFTFYRNGDHELDLILYYFETFGWESEITLTIEKNGIDYSYGVCLYSCF